MIMDVMVATIALLKQDADLDVLVGARIWGDKMPIEEANAVPRGNIVVRHVPSASLGPTGGYVELQMNSYDITCYGKTPKEAKDIYLEVYRILKHARRQVIVETLIHSFTQIMSPRSFVDPDIRWDAIISGWNSLASEKQVAS